MELTHIKLLALYAGTIFFFFNSKNLVYVPVFADIFGSKEAATRLEETLLFLPKIRTISLNSE